MKNSTKKLISNIVTLFFSAIYGTMIWAFLRLGIEIVPANIMGPIFLMLFLFVVYKVIQGVILNKKRIKRVIGIATYVSVFSFMMATVAGASMSYLVDKVSAQMLLSISLVVMILVCIVPFIDLYRKVKNLLNPKVLINDIKAALNFTIAIITILYGASTYFGDTELLRSFTFISLFPFGLNILALAIIYYRETKEDDEELKFVA